MEFEEQPLQSKTKGKTMLTDTNIPIYSKQDILDALKNYRRETSEEAFEPILYFASDLMGISVDEILNHI